MPKLPTIKAVVTVIGYFVLLGCSIVFGLLGRPAEMGLSIVAGAIALAFADIGRFSQIKGAGFEAVLRQKMETVIEKETEPPVDEEVASPVPDISRIDENTRSVINALQHHKYTWRYIAGIKRDTSLDTQTIEKSLSWLRDNGYAQKTQGKHGSVWNLTEQGRHLSAVIDFS